jgi:hypothetical protein
MRQNFCFIFNTIDFKGKIPLEILPRYWFRKATTKEIQYIKKVLAGYRSEPDMITALYEFKFIPSNKDGTSWNSVRLPRKEWRYYVISFDGFSDKIVDLRYSANLLKHDISIGFEFLSLLGDDNYGWGDNRFISSTFFVDHQMGPQQELFLESDELLEIKNIHNNIVNLDKRRYSNICRAVSEFQDTKMITNRSVLKELSYFFIIECIITHDPSGTIDSLTHQISTKMSLLSKLFQRKLDYTLHFPQLNEPEKVWKKLYSYRSTIAHGSEANFDGEFKSLLSHDNIREFLKESLKLLLLYSLKEPDFVTDLQRC